MTTIAPPALVQGAARTPLPFGLFSTFTFRTGDRWESGVSWDSPTCDPASGIGQWVCPPDTVVGLPKDLDPNGGVVGVATPFTVYGHFNCSPVGSGDAAELALAHLLSREEQAVEYALWTGNLGNIPNLREAGPVMGGAPQSVGDGLAYLEYVIATGYGSVGVIHMTRGMALLALGEDLLETVGGRLQTRLGTPVVAGSGYDGTGPAGTPALTAGQSWAYATPALFGYRSEPFSPGEPVLDRGQNVLMALAERNYLIGYDPCGTAAVLLDLNLATGGGTP